MKKILRQIFLVLLVTAIAFSLSAPFLIIERWLGFTVLILLSILFFSFQTRLKVKSPPIHYTIGLILALLLLIPASFFARFVEGGFDDGPFMGRRFDGDVGVLKSSETIKFRKGNLIVYNRKEEAPVIAYRIGGRTQWATELYVTMNPASNKSELYKIEKVSLTKGIVRDRLDFIGYWTYGAEHGYAFIWKFGGIQRLYLSW